MIALYSWASAASITTGEPLAPPAPRMLQGEEYHRVGSGYTWRDKKCATVNGGDPTYEWLSGVRGKIACEKSCKDMGSECKGFSPSPWNCLIWTQEVSTEKLQYGWRWQGCYFKGYCPYNKSNGESCARNCDCMEKNCTRGKKCC